MKGFAMLEKGKTGIIEKPDPVLRCPTDALVRVTAVAPCTSDVHSVEMGAFPGMFGNFIGHEAVGVVEEVGADVKDFKKGDRVAIADISPRFDDMVALAGMPHYTEGCLRTFNPELQGMFAEYVLYERADTGLAHIPDGVTDVQAVMVTDMLATCAAAMNFLDIQLGETVAILGIGPVGLAGLDLVVHGGAGRVYAVGSRQACFDAAEKLGASDLVNYRDGSIVEQILQKNGGPVDKVFVCGGNSSDIVAEGLAICRNGGKVANVSMFFDVAPANAQIASLDHFDKAFQSFRINCNRYILEGLLAMIQYKRLRPELYVSHVMEGMENIPVAFDMMARKDPEMIKPVVKL